MVPCKGSAVIGLSVDLEGTKGFVQCSAERAFIDIKGLFAGSLCFLNSLLLVTKSDQLHVYVRTCFTMAHNTV